MIDLKKSAIFGVILSSALVLSACSLYGTNNTGTGEATQNQQAPQQATGQAEAAATVTFSDNGVSPTTVTIKSGQAVKWVNSSSNAVQVASDPHPTHTDNRELTNGESTFALAAGASATVTLTKKGTWGFHDHLNPSVRGKVTVE